MNTFVVRLKSLYHLSLSLFGAVVCGWPSRRMNVIGVTGTKGKSSTTEMISAIFEEAGVETAMLNSIRMKIGKESERNEMRMSMPGRFYIQRLLLKALRRGCRVAIIEMTSEGARQHRERGISLDALVFMNLAPEHIESHGSYEAYEEAKFKLGLQLARSKKRPRIIVANADDAHSKRYLALKVEKSLPFSVSADATRASDERGGHFKFEGEDIAIHLPGEFSLQNALAAATVTRAFGIPVATIRAALGKMTVIPGRAERIDAGQDFDVVVDYAHTPDSLKALYEAYAARRKICVMGATGGGRDKWKRPVMGEMASQYCDVIILTNEDPYDEDPRKIVDGLASGIVNKVPEVVMDRREAIARGISIAQAGEAVLITGKGTDPNIAGPRGTKLPWSDAQVAREEIEKLLEQRV